MEDILSSIKRIIAEEGDTPPGGARIRRTPRTAPVQPATSAADTSSILELSDRFSDDDDLPVAPHADPHPPRAVRPAVEEPVASVEAAEAAAAPAPEPILSDEAAQASRGALDSLSRLIVKPEAESATTLEGMVREMLRPMLREWLDAKLPAMVEAMVAREIERITDQQR